MCETQANHSDLILELILSQVCSAFEILAQELRVDT